MKEIFLATRNRHKTREIQTMLGVIVHDATEISELPEIEETGKTFEANARLKAEGISKYVSGFVLADDSGLEVDALGGEPGIYSARYAELTRIFHDKSPTACESVRETALGLNACSGSMPDPLSTHRPTYLHQDAQSLAAISHEIFEPGCTDLKNTKLVLKKMEGVPQEKRTGRFRCVLAVAYGGKTIVTFDGTIEGRLTTEIKGEGGFGYDSIFIPTGYEKTFGELPSEVKNAMSHRRRALEQFKIWFLDK